MPRLTDEPIDDYNPALATLGQYDVPVDEFMSRWDE
jgi:hypothetical protein